MNMLEALAKVHEPVRVLLLFLTKPLGHFVDVSVTLLGKLSSMLTHFFNDRVNIHPNTPILQAPT